MIKSCFFKYLRCDVFSLYKPRTKAFKSAKIFYQGQDCKHIANKTANLNKKYIYIYTNTNRASTSDQIDKTLLLFFHFVINLKSNEKKLEVALFKFTLTCICSCYFGPTYICIWSSK